MHKTSSCLLLLAFLCAPAGAQQKQRFASLTEAIQSNGILGGRSGPVNVNWFENGNRFSYIVSDPTTRGESIHAMDPATGKDTTLFGAEHLMVPGTNTAFTYDAFQWAHDSKHLLF
jgi:dipeptidyl-peptidase-4